MNTKLLAKFQVYIFRCSHFRGILSICHFYSILTVKSSFCEHRPSINGHCLRSCDTALKFGQNALGMWIWEEKKFSPKTFSSGRY